MKSTPETGLKSYFSQLADEILTGAITVNEIFLFILISFQVISFLFILVVGQTS